MATVIVITAKRNGFRRCGVAHSEQPITWQPSDFTSEQWRDLVKEPQLIVTCVEVDLEPEWEPRYALTSSTTLPEASSAIQVAEPQASETILTPVAAPVVSDADATLVDDKSGAAAPGLPGADSAGTDGLVIDGQGTSDGDGGVVDAPLANSQPGSIAPGMSGADSSGDGGVVDQPSDAQPDKAMETGKPAKAKPGRAKGTAK